MFYANIIYLIPISLYITMGNLVTFLLVKKKVYKVNE